MNRPRVTLFGTGLMGVPLAGRLLDAGYTAIRFELLKHAFNQIPFFYSFRFKVRTTALRRSGLSVPLVVWVVEGV
ncbi:MAG TPA: hypothetical protein ENI94_11670 [Gammaproteobacteria bacterium]|nr:hypothetical protein [Gammaproteobacteria bacterium]